MRNRSITWCRKSLLTLTATFGLGACAALMPGLTAASSALAAEHHLRPEPHAAKVAVGHPGGAVSLEDFVTGPAVDTMNYGGLQADIITTIPLTEPPASEGGEDDEPGALDPDDYVEFEKMRVPRWIVDTILRASDATGADPVYMMALADKESSFIPANKATTSSAEGLFQFISSTWLETLRSFGRKHGLTMEASAVQLVNGQLTIPDEAMRAHIMGLRRNPYLSALMASEMMQRDKAKIEKRLGRKLSRSEFYLSHFFGVDSASKFIALVDDTPKKSAQSAFPAAARSNKALFFAKNGKKTRQLSVAEVYGKIDTMIDKRLERYEDVSSRVVAPEAVF